MNDQLAMILVVASLALILFGGALVGHLDWLARRMLRDRRQRRRMGMVKR